MADGPTCPVLSVMVALGNQVAGIDCCCCCSWAGALIA